jgi:hypothetical protein
MHLIIGQNNFDKYEFTRFRQLYISTSSLVFVNFILFAILDAQQWLL